MFFQDRWYQVDGARITADCILAAPKCNPVCAVPTAAGKSIMQCHIVDHYLSARPQKDVLLLSNVSDILEQNHTKLFDYFSEIDIGLYSAGLGSRTVNKITVAGIDSVYRRPHLFKNVGLVGIDECHRINNEDEGRYRNFLKKLDAQYFGLTATPFRTGQGYIYRGKHALFNHLSYDLTSFENYNRLLDEGWLCPLIPLPTSVKMDTKGIGSRGGDFKEEELTERFTREDITNAITDQIIKYGAKKYKKWLIFAIDQDHADMIANSLNKKGYPTGVVYSGAVESKDSVLRKYRKGEYRAVVNVNMLTTGLDIPEIDLIAHCRPTQSPVFHVQSNGRGGRCVYAPGYDLNILAERLKARDEGKSHCLVLDFAGNTARLGPINDVYVKEPGEKGGDGGPMVKECPECTTLNHLSAKECIACGYEFPRKEKITSIASSLDLIRTKKNLEQWVEVKDVSYSVHQKKGSKSCLRVSYNCGFMSFSKWVHLESYGYPRDAARAWVKFMYSGLGDMPSSLNDLWKDRHLLRVPSHIFVNQDGKYPEIKKYKFDKGDNLPIKLKTVKDIPIDDDIPF